MDLVAYRISMNQKVAEYITKHYGAQETFLGEKRTLPPPRLRGVRFMKVEKPGEARFWKNVWGELRHAIWFDEWRYLPAYWRRNKKEIFGCFFRGLSSPLTILGSSFKRANACRLQVRKFNRYVGKDVIYIHTRTGYYKRGLKYDCRYNYANYAYDWIESFHWGSGQASLIDECLDAEDGTYMDFYFEAIKDSEYEKIIKEFNGEEEDNNGKSKQRKR